MHRFTYVDIKKKKLERRQGWRERVEFTQDYTCKELREISRKFCFQISRSMCVSWTNVLLSTL